MANKQPPVFSLLIINKAGGLIYQKTYAGVLVPCHHCVGRVFDTLLQRVSPSFRRTNTSY